MRVVVPAGAQPGLACPANAGVMLDVDIPRPPVGRRFYHSEPLSPRAGEKLHHRRVVDVAGICTFGIDAALRFEGEPDPAGDRDLLTAQVHEHAVTPLPVDVSEFLEKVGGSVKCMIGDLGPVLA